MLTMHVAIDSLIIKLISLKYKHRKLRILEMQLKLKNYFPLIVNEIKLQKTTSTFVWHHSMPIHTPL